MGRNYMNFINKDNAVDFVGVLMEDRPDEYGANEIHLYTDGTTWVVEWVQYSQKYDSPDHFVYKDEDHELVYKQSFPDGHYDYYSDEEMAAEALNDWLKDNPDWHKNQWGIWEQD